MRTPWLLTWGLVLALLVGIAGAEERFYDFGTPEDFSAENPVWFPPAPVNYWLWGSHDPKTFIRYETADNFWWVTAPRGKDREQAVSARVLKHRHEGFFRAKTIPNAKTLWVAIRIKDNLLEPTTLWVKGSKDWSMLGKVGGTFDHAWKTQIVRFETADAAVADGAYDFRISNQNFGDLMGDLAVDWIRVTDTEPRPEPDKPGFWPVPPPTKFTAIGRTQSYDIGAPGQFIVGAMIKGARTGTWKEMKAAGANHLDLQSWEFNWRRGWEVYRDERFPDRVRFGFGDWNDACAEAGLSGSVQFFTDSRSYWIENQYGNEQKMLRTLGDVVNLYKAAKPNLVWYPKDEADHDDPSWGAPPEFVLQMTATIREKDPDTPILVLFQGWKPRVYEIYRDSFDVAAFDVYPLGAEPPRSATEIASRVDDMRKQLGDSKALWAVVEAHDGEHVRNSGRMLTQQQTLVQGYLAVVHGVQGVLYFVDNEGRYIDMADMPGPWAGMKQFFTEITDPKTGIERFLVPPAQVVDIMGEKGDLRVWKPELHTTLRKRGDEYALIAVNASDAPVSNGRVYVKGLREGLRLTPRWEDRVVITEHEVIVDDFEPFGRHVYIIPASAVNP